MEGGRGTKGCWARAMKRMKKKTQEGEGYGGGWRQGWSRVPRLVVRRHNTGRKWVKRALQAVKERVVSHANDIPDSDSVH